MLSKLNVQEEVEAFAKQEMASLSGGVPPSTPQKALSVSPARDKAATIDELRAEIAYARSSLNQIRLDSQLGSISS
jgi:hypothetical protein